MAAPQGSTGQQDNVTTMHRYKIPPPYYNGEYATYEEWRYKFLAYIGLQDPEFPELIQLAEDANQQITNALIDQAIADTDKATRWKRLAADLHYILVNICTGPAATVCRQNLLNTNGLETWRPLRHRFSIPTGTRSVGYLTKLLKPTLDENKFEEAFAQWEHDVQRYEQDNGTPLPEGVKNTPERNKGSTTTALTAQRHNSHNIQPDQDRYPGILPVNISIHADAGSDQHSNEQQPRPSTNGHWSNVQRTQGQRQRRKRQRKGQRKRRKELQQQQFQQQLRQRRQRSNRPRKPFQRRNDRLRLQQRKRKTRTNRSKR